LRLVHLGPEKFQGKKKKGYFAEPAVGENNEKKPRKES